MDAYIKDEYILNPVIVETELYFNNETENNDAALKTSRPSTGILIDFLLNHKKYNAKNITQNPTSTFNCSGAFV